MHDIISNLNDESDCFYDTVEDNPSPAPHNPEPEQEPQPTVEEPISETQSEPNEIEETKTIEIIDFQTEWSQLSDNEKMLGLIAPVWLPDTEAENCMKCNLKFSFRKRRHHCRACGLIFCSKCCDFKIHLPYKMSK